MAWYNFRKQTPAPIQEPQKEQNFTDVFFTMAASRPELPVIKEDKRNGFIMWGDDNLYPNKLIEYLNTSAIHGAIVENKAKMQAGKGILWNNTQDQTASAAFIATLPLDKQIEIKRLIDTPNSSDSLQEVLGQLALDYQIHGCYALEVIWSVDFSRIAELKRLPMKNVRVVGKQDGEIKEFLYSRDWSKTKQKGFEPRCIKAFDQRTPQLYKDYVADNSLPCPSYNQIIYVRHERSGLEYYGEPTYQSALSYIKIDSQIGLFHLSNIENGFNPSMTVKFFKMPASPEERTNIVRAINQQYGGAKNTGKVMVFFSDDKDSAPDVQPVNVQNLDKQFMVLADQVVQQIVAGHSLTSPMIVGIAIPGKLGYSTELETAYKGFESFVIGPERQLLEKTLQKVFKANGIDAPLNIEQFKPYL